MYITGTLIFVQNSHQVENIDTIILEYVACDFYSFTWPSWQIS